MNDESISCTAISLVCVFYARFPSGARPRRIPVQGNLSRAVGGSGYILGAVRVLGRVRVRQTTQTAVNRFRLQEEAT